MAIRPDTCKHFTGIGQDCCKAGVNYRELAGEPMLGMALRLPCIEGGRDRALYDPAKVVSCERREAPTADEVQAAKDAARERMRRQSALTSEGDDHHIWQCNLCPGSPWPQFSDATAYTDHLVEAHGYERPVLVRREMAAHLDAADWHQTNYAHYRDDALIGYESHRYARRGSDAALWGAKPKKKGRGRR